MLFEYFEYSTFIAVVGCANDAGFICDKAIVRWYGYKKNTPSTSRLRIYVHRLKSTFGKRDM